MENKKKEIKMRYLPDANLFEIDGVAYIPFKTRYKKIGTENHVDYVIYKKADVDAEKKKLEFLKKKLSDKVPRERIIEEALKNLSRSDVDRIYKLIKEKKATVKRQDGCLGLFIDGGKYNRSYLELYD